jgi:hypothetical protein
MVYGIAGGIAEKYKRSGNYNAIEQITNTDYHNIPSRLETDSVFLKKLYLEIFSLVV